jgi:hypothetical protein
MNSRRRAVNSSALRPTSFVRLDRSCRDLLGRARHNERILAPSNGRLAKRGKQEPLPASAGATLAAASSRGFEE